MSDQAAPTLSDASAAMAAAIAAENNVAEATPAVEAVVPNAVEATPPTETPAVETPVVNNVDGIDLSALPEDVQQKIRDGFLRHQDYTKKTQEVAPYRKFVEEVGTDLEQVRKSVEFVNRLENDPDFLAQVASELADLAKGQAPAAEQAPNAVENAGTDPQLVRTVNELNEWKAQQEQERINASIVAEWENKLQTAENAIRESNPSYSEDDIKQIYKYLPAVEYDLFKAQESYEEMRNYFQNQLLKPKLNHPGEANPVNAGTLANQPKEVRTFEEAAAITRERLRAAG